MPRMLDALSRLVPWRRPLPEPKASRTGALVAIETLGQPVWAPRDYGAFAREGFMQNAVVYRSVRMIAEAAASIPLLLYEGETEIEAHPLLDLVRKPNAEQTSVDLLEAWYGYLLVSGNAYCEAVAAGGRLRELHALRPDRMKVVPGADGWPEAYEYAAGGHSVRFDAEPMAGVRPILHVKLFHPANDHYGMSPIEAAATAIDIHNTASGWNKALLDNAARPSGALVLAAREGRLTGEQYERLKGELEAGFQGARNAGRPLLLEGGLDWKPLSLSPKDMDFIEAKNAAAREIALALGVPPMLLGIPGDNTYANYQEATRSFWRQTVLPLVDRTAKALSGWLAPAWGEALELKADLDRVEALAGEREALWARLEAASFLTTDEKRAAVGYGPLEVDDNDGVAPEIGARVALKYSPDQPRVPAGNSDGGQWTSGGGGGLATGTDDGRVISDAEEPGLAPWDEVAQMRGPLRTVRIGNRLYQATEQQETRLLTAANRAETALERVRRLDPEWTPAPEATAIPPSTEGAIASYTALAQQAEFRATVIERGGVPLGFASADHFRDFGRSARAALSEAGYRDAEPYLRGSSVTGYSYETGEPFDVGRRSDYDLAIVSPTLFNRATALGVRSRGRGGRTVQIDGNALRDLGLRSLLDTLASDIGRDVSVVIYRSNTDLQVRGPSLPLP
ncbi:MAG: phage portal protein [Pseudomonadota bacterium]